MKQWEVYIRLPRDNGVISQVKTALFAENVHRAIQLFEAQYGKGSLIGIPREVK